MRSCRRGLTLLEMIVAAALFGLLATLIVQVLVPVGKGSVRATQQVELQQSAALALDQLARDVTASAPRGVTVAASGGTAADSTALVGIQRLQDVAADGSQVLDDRLVVVWWNAQEGRLWRKTWPPGPPDDDDHLPGTQWRLSAAELGQVAAAQNGYERMLARNVKSFSLTLNAESVSVKLSLEAPAPDGRPPERFELERHIYLRSVLY